uniref:Uncharacterized protein n=1 Tax=Arundo donax TaxID=35708 RepID=A0A0A9DZZ5_ARUDO
MCQIKVFSAPLLRNQTGITVFYFCSHHPHRKINTKKGNKTKGCQRRAEQEQFEESIRSSYSIRKNCHSTPQSKDWTLSLSKFRII